MRVARTALRVRVLARTVITGPVISGPVIAGPVMIVIAAALLAGLATFPTSTCAQNGVATGDAERLYKASELQTFTETFVGDFLKLWEGPSTKISPARSEIAQRQVDKYFGAGVLEAALIEEFGKRIAASETQAVLEWTSGSVGKSLFGQPRTAHDSNLYGVLEGYAEAHPAPVPQSRAKLLAQIGHEALLDQIYITTTSAGALLVGLTLAAGTDPPEAIPDDAWAKLMPGLYGKAFEARTRYTQAAASVLQVEHQHASDSDLQGYLEFRGSADGRWLSKETATALVDVLQTQQRAYTTNLQRIFSKIQ